MSYHPFFDAMVYPWPREDAQAFHATLAKLIKNPNDIQLHYETCGGTTALTPGLASHHAWKEVLDLLTMAKGLKTLCDRILEAGALKVAHPIANSIIAAQDLLFQTSILPEDIIFLDRKNLRNELEALSRPGANKVLLVRGPSGVGKSHTQELVKAMASDRGIAIVYLYDGTVSLVDDVIAELFTALGDSTRVPPVDETRPAWYRRVCLKLQQLASEKKVILWVVADDLGVDGDGISLLDPEIRGFFNQVALHMENPAFAQWFRLILLDYPDGAVPTKWRKWAEDRPDEKEVDDTVIADCLLASAQGKGKQLGTERAKELAVEIIQRVDSQPKSNGLDSRLRRINLELQAITKKL